MTSPLLPPTRRAPRPPPPPKRAGLPRSPPVPAGPPVPPVHQNGRNSPSSRPTDDAKPLTSPAKTALPLLTSFRDRPRAGTNTGSRTPEEQQMNVLDTFALTGRRALVTGGNRGLGRAFALALAEAGADVAIAARDSARNAAVVTELE